MDEFESKPDEIRLCKHILTFEAKLWSIVTLPLMIFKYVNWCMFGSIMRIVWIPALYYIYVYKFIPLWILGSDGYVIAANRSPVFYWLVLGFLIGVVGIISTIYIILESNSNTAKYIKSKWMW